MIEGTKQETENTKTQETMEETEEQSLEQAIQEWEQEKQNKKLVSEGARKTAAVVLEVMAGTIKPSDAADVLGITTVSYYNLEARALQGMVRACETLRKARA